MADYNGWANWETWNVALWLGNEEPLYRDYTRLMSRCDDLDEFRDKIEAYVRETLPEGTPDMDSAKDYALVDWDEIASNLWSEGTSDD